jgi:hypothetical protein
VVVMGNPSLLPVLDGEEAIRTFHVTVSRNIIFIIYIYILWDGDHT